MNIPKSILEQGDPPQWKDKVDGKNVEIYYDDDESGVSPVNKYAVFSDIGFHGWLDLGFTLADIYLMVNKNIPRQYPS